MPNLPEQKPTPLPRFRLDDAGSLRLDVAKQHKPIIPRLTAAKLLHRTSSFKPKIKSLPSLFLVGKAFLGQAGKVLARLVRNSRHLTKRSYHVAASSLCLLLLVGVIAHFHGLSFGSSGSVEGAQTAKGPVPATPDFKGMVPAGKTIAELGGWYRISPPGRDPVYAFSDHIGTIAVDVSEQPLPQSFKQNTAEQISQLALGFGADQRITAASITVYIGTSSSGPQSVILAKNGLLVLIKSTDKLSNDQWITYVSSLQ